ncbi:MAG: secretin N-terminal domain-containing protein [Verrucomicrobiota bacterium]
MVSLQFPQSDVENVLKFYERLIEKPLIRDSSIFNNSPQISLITPEDIPKSEAIRLIEATLLVNGFVLIEEPDSGGVKVLRGGDRAGPQNPAFSEGTMIYTDPSMIPSGDQVIGFFMTLEYVDPEDAVAIFANHIQLNQFGRITPVLSPSGVLITETAPIVRQMIKLRTIIDWPVEEAPLITEFVRLQHAEANVVAQIIQAAMDARMAERQRRSQEARTVTGARSDGAKKEATQTKSQAIRMSSGNETSLGTATQPAAQLIPDDRLNRIMVVASPSDVAYILGLIGEFDQEADTPQPTERPLNYVKANDILPVLVDVVQDTGTGETQLPGGRQIQTRATPITSAQLASLTGVQRNQNNQNRNNSSGADTVGGRVDQIAFPVDEVAPISVLIGKTRIIADRQANSIIVIGPDKDKQVIMQMIDRLDRRPVQVYLATVIGELNLTDDVQFGVDYLAKFLNSPNGNGVSGGLIGGRDITGNIADMANMVVSTPFGPSNGLNVYGQLGASLDVIVSALETTNRFKVLSRPVVYTQNGKRAEITSGQEVPVPVQSLSDTNNVNAVQTSIDFKEVVLKLEVLPTINQDDVVTLDIVQINDRVIGNQQVANNTVPIIGKQELNTTVTVANRSTIVLGGLISESKTVNDAGIPVIKRVPILGNAAKTTTNSKIRSELMIFIQPIVVHGDQEAVISSYDEDVRGEIGQEAATVFPEPGAPTLIQRDNMEIEEIEERQKPLQKFGQRIFGKKRPVHRALPIGE